MTRLIKNQFILNDVYCIWSHIHFFECQASIITSIWWHSTSPNCLVKVTEQAISYWCGFLNPLITLRSHITTALLYKVKLFATSNFKSLLLFITFLCLYTFFSADIPLQLTVTGISIYFSPSNLIFRMKLKKIYKKILSLFWRHN